MGVFDECEARGLLPKEAFWPEDWEKDADPCSATQPIDKFPVGQVVLLVEACVSVGVQFLALWMALGTKVGLAKYGAGKRRKVRFFLRSLPNLVFTISSVHFSIKLQTTQVRYLQDLQLTSIQCVMFASLWLAIYLHWRKFVYHTKKIKIRALTSSFKEGQTEMKSLSYDPLRLIQIDLGIKMLTSLYPLCAYLWLVEFGAPDSRTVVVSVFVVCGMVTTVPLAVFIILFALPTLQNLKQMVELSKKFDPENAWVIKTSQKMFLMQVTVWSISIFLANLFLVIVIFVRSFYLNYITVIAALNIGVPLATFAPAVSKVVQLRAHKKADACSHCSKAQKDSFLNLRVA